MTNDTKKFIQHASVTNWPFKLTRHSLARAGKNNPFKQAYNDVMTQYQAAVRAGTVSKYIQNNINFGGYAIYSYQDLGLANNDALTARP